jgi:uncharacterized protein (TIGR02453 family)
MEFAGLHPDAIEFYRELWAHNDKAWWTANKPRYDERVRAPFEALGEALGAEFGAVKIFRPYRDVRFSADKSPYKDHIGMVTHGNRGAVHYLQLGADGLLAAGGVYDPSTPQLARFRAIADDVRLFGDLEATLEELAELGFDVIETDALTTAPRGFRADHPRIRLLRLKRLAVQRPLGLEEWMWTPTALDRIRDVWRGVSIWCDWVAENVGSEPATR